MVFSPRRLNLLLWCQRSSNPWGGRTSCKAFQLYWDPPTGQETKENHCLPAQEANTGWPAWGKQLQDAGRTCSLVPPHPSEPLRDLLSEGAQHEPPLTLSPPFQLLFQAMLELAAAASFSDSAVISGEFMAFPSCQH